MSGVSVLGSRMTQDLHRLLSAAGISRYHHELWFGGCVLGRGSTLTVPDAELAQTITRCFLTQLRAVLPALAVVVDTTAVEAPAYAHLLKKSRRPKHWHPVPEPSNGDLF